MASFFFEFEANRTASKKLKGAMLRAGNMGPLHEWLPEALWPKIKALRASNSLVA